MRIVFVGAVEFSRHCLAEVIHAGGDVVAVLTLAPQDAGFHSDYADLGPVADAHRIPLHCVRRLDDPETLALLRGLSPDVLLVLGWSQLLPPEVLAIPRLGAIGSHPALLPANRGRHPIVWALVEGLQSSGLTFFYLDEGADSGDIVWQGEFEILLEDDAASVYRKIEALASRGIGELVPQLAAGTAGRIPQDESRASYWRRRTDADRRIDWNASSMQIYNLVRGLARPYVGATTSADGKELVVWRALPPSPRLVAGSAAFAPGTVVEAGAGPIEVRTGDGTLTLVELEPRPVLKVGDRLGDAA